MRTKKSFYWLRSAILCARSSQCARRVMVVDRLNIPYKIRDSPPPPQIAPPKNFRKPNRPIKHTYKFLLDKPPADMPSKKSLQNQIGLGCHHGFLRYSENTTLSNCGKTHYDFMGTLQQNDCGSGERPPLYKRIKKEEVSLYS